MASGDKKSEPDQPAAALPSQPFEDRAAALRLAFAEFLQQRNNLTPSEAAAEAGRIRIKATSATTTTTNYIGPVPHPDIAVPLEHAAPGSIDRLFAMAERDQAAYIASRIDITHRDDRFRIVALSAGVLALGLLTSAVIYLAIQNHDGVAAALAAVGFAGIIGAIVNARMQQRPSLASGNELDDDPGDDDDQHSPSTSPA